MMLRNSAAIVVVLAATTMWGQSSAGRLAARSKPVIATSNAEGISAAARAKAAANEHLQEMASTLAKMHSLLKQMRGNAAKDPVAKANLEMWSLMVGELDKQYEQLSLAARQREDFEARRAALYKQADQKAAEAAKKAQESAKPREAPKDASADSNANNQTPAAAQTPATPPASSTSPN
jgi:hypothetical protein